tara:strand:+ start:504 stop:1298 length:795 start_codon:yes stop_codon:yes gene_type:complete
MNVPSPFQLINQNLKLIQEDNEKLREENKQLKEDDHENTDALDEKDEEILKLNEQNEDLITKLAQKSNEVGLQDERLSQKHNGLKGKLAKAENTIKELTKQIDETKINYLDTLENKITALNKEVTDLKEGMTFCFNARKDQDEFLKDEGYTYEADKGWIKDEGYIHIVGDEWAVSGDLNNVNQELVNKNIDSVIKFMKMIEPENSHNARNWKKALLKDWRLGKSRYTIISYVKYTQGVVMKNNYTNLIDKKLTSLARPRGAPSI